MIRSPKVVSLDTIGCLEELLEDARQGDLVGVAFAALYHDRNYVVDATGEARTEPTYSRGMICRLDDALGKLERGES